MKNIIDSRLGLRITGDTIEDIKIDCLEKKYGFYIDESYFPEEDGEVMIDDKLVPFKAGDVIIVYNIWNRVNSKEVDRKTVIIPNTEQFAIALKNSINEII